MNDLKKCIERIAKLTKEEVGVSEENVKQKIVVPLLECLGHHRNQLDFEYGSGSKRIDIFIKDLPVDCKVVIDVKNYDEDLDNHLEQIGLYAFQEGALLALIINGKEIRVYDPFFRGFGFRNSLLYSIKREDLIEDKNIEILKNMLLRDYLISKKVREFIIEREKEILDAYSKIEKIKEKYAKKRKELEDRRKSLLKKISVIEHEINEISKQEKEDIEEIMKSVGIFYPVDTEYPQEKITPSERQATRNIFAKTTNKIEIILHNLHTPKRYALIPIPKEYRRFFPGYKVPFILETDIGEIKTKVTSAPKGTEYGDPDAGNYIQGGLKPWYNKHKDLKEGDKLIIEVIEPKKRYRLYVEKR